MIVAMLFFVGLTGLAMAVIRYSRPDGVLSDPWVPRVWVIVTSEFDERGMSTPVACDVDHTDPVGKRVRGYDRQMWRITRREEKTCSRGGEKWIQLYAVPE